MVTSLLVWFACAQAAPATGPRVIAIGDLHADLDNALAALQLAGVIDAEGSWAAGSATVVQTGDTTDRGPDSRAILALMRRLSTEAQAAGGRLVPLLGNHELMNLLGDWRYVHPGDIEAYGGEESRRAALAPNGEDGSWLRTLDAVAVVGDTVFAHGGVHPDHASGGVDALNDAVRAAIAGDPDAVVLGPTGPLWYRGYVQDPEEVACPTLDRALALLGAARMVVGHTTRKDGRIASRCGGRLAVIDIGIADHYGAHLGAWEARGVDARALYPTGPVDLVDPDGVSATSR